MSFCKRTTVSGIRGSKEATGCSSGSQGRRGVPGNRWKKVELVHGLEQPIPAARPQGKPERQKLHVAHRALDAVGYLCKVGLHDASSCGELKVGGTRGSMPILGDTEATTAKVVNVDLNDNVRHERQGDLPQDFPLLVLLRDEESTSSSGQTVLHDEVHHLHSPIDPQRTRRVEDR